MVLIDPNPPVVNGRNRAIQSSNGPLTRGLLVIVGAEVSSCVEITELSGRGQSTGRVSVDVDVDPAADHDAVRLQQCRSLTEAAGTNFGISADARSKIRA